MTTPLEELRFVQEAHLFKAGVLAGRLERRPDSVIFSYEPGYVAAGGEPMATTLPVSTTPVRTHAASALPPFFSGMLPEGRRISALRQAVKTSADDELSLLLAVGADAVGDVQVVPAGETPTEVEPRLGVDAWDQVSFGDLFAEATGGGAIDRVALPGVQDKVSARMVNVPVASAGERFILKLSPPEFPHVVENEAFFLGAAAASGLAVAQAEVVRDAGGVPGLLVRRFDRVASADGGVHLLAQEDGCQVLGRYPADKYNLSAEEVGRTLVAVTRARPVAARDLFRQLVFAYVSCNGDAHGKNVSVHRDLGGEWRVTPAYDLPSTYPYGDATVALRIGGKSREDIGRADLIVLAGAIGLRERPAVRVIDEIVDVAPTWIAHLDELPFDERRLHKLERAVRYRLGRLADGAGSSPVGPRSP